MPASKTIKWTPEQVKSSFPNHKGKEVFTCVVDKFRRPSAVPGAKPGQKCIVIIID